MDLADFVTELPITLANWHSGSSYGVPIGSNRSITLHEQDYLDSGGSGIFVHRPDASTIKTYQLKCDSMGTSPFYPKCFTIPMASSTKERYDQIPTDFTLHRSHGNSLLYDQRLECFFSVDSLTNRIDLYRLDRSEESPSLSKLDLISSTSSLCLEEHGPVCEISPANYNSNSDDVSFFVRQSNAISLLRLNEENDQLSLLIDPITFEPGDRNLGQLVNRFDKFTEFWKLSKSHLLRNSLALGQYGEDDSVTLSDYNLETKQFLWTCKSSKTDFKGNLSWINPVGLFWTDHPKLLAYCERSHFGLLDTRDRSNNSMVTIMAREKLQYARDWERFRGVCQLSSSDTQFLLSMDHKVILVDRRFPNQNLLTWCHTLRTSTDDLPKFLSSTSLTNSTESIITLANKNQSCLMTVNPFELTNITQPKSLHMPLHLSQPADCWHFSSNATESIQRRLENCILTGLIVIPCENGYSVCQSTSDNNIYVQDFYPSSTIEPEYRVNWKRSCLMENLPIPHGIDSLLESVFSNMFKSAESSEPIDELISNLQGDRETSLERPPPAIKPKFLMPLPGTTDEIQSSTEPDDEAKLSEFAEDLIGKRLNLLTNNLDEIDENYLTIKLLSKWRDDTN